MAETKDYLTNKARKKKSGLKALWLMLILLFVIVSMVIKIIFTGTLKPDVFTGLPSSDEAYVIAKGFVRPTLKSSTADFEDSKYQFAKTSDSVYVIKSSVIAKVNNENIATSFKVTLKYNGGQASNEKNWALINIDEN
jgi:hypothetical protein